MQREEKLRNFYREIKNLTEKNPEKSKKAFLKMIFTLFLGEKFHGQEESIYDNLLVENLTYNEYKKQGFSTEALMPFSLIDKNYYQELRQKYNTEEHRTYQTVIIDQLEKDLAFDEESMITRSLKEIDPEMEEIFKTIKQIIKEVQEKDSFSMETINLFALSSAYFRLYKPSLDKKEVEEQILKNKVNELLNKKTDLSENLEEKTKIEQFISDLEGMHRSLDDFLKGCEAEKDRALSLTQNPHSN